MSPRLRECARTHCRCHCHEPQSARKSTGGRCPEPQKARKTIVCNCPKPQSARKSTGLEYTVRQSARKSTGSISPKPVKVPKLESKTGEEEQTKKARPVLDSHLDLLREGRFSDVTFIVGESKERIPCHQLFLKARSTVFEVMFSERWNQDKAKEIQLEDVNPETFRKFLQFIYADTLDAEVPEILELLQLAHKYDVQQLTRKCEERLRYNVTSEDAVGVFQAARKYERKELMDTIGEMFAESLSELQALPSFSQLDKETLIYILKREDLEMTEVDLFRLALQWAGNQTDATIEESLKDILPLIRFPIMNLNEFTTIVVPTKVLPPSTVIELFTYFGTKDKAKRRVLGRTLGFSTRKRQQKDWDSTDSPSSSSDASSSIKSSGD